MTKMKKETKEQLFYKKECDRTKTEKLVRDIVCYGVVVYAAIMGFLLVDANAKLASAQAQLVSSQIMSQQQPAS